MRYKLELELNLDFDFDLNLIRIDLDTLWNLSKLSLHIITCISGNKKNTASLVYLSFRKLELTQQKRRY